MEATTLRTPSFKEDTYFVSQLKSSEKKALQELKDKLMGSEASDGSMWGGVLLLGNDEKADVILLKFLRARDFRVPDAFAMLLKCLAWSKEFGADGVVEEDLGFKELEGVVAYMHGFDKQGHPVCYNAYGVFKDRDMYERIFGDDEKLKKFLRWRVQVLERGINALHFKPGGINSIIQPCGDQHRERDEEVVCRQEGTVAGPVQMTEHMPSELNPIEHAELSVGVNIVDHQVQGKGKPDDKPFQRYAAK